MEHPFRLIKRCMLGLIAISLLPGLAQAALFTETAKLAPANSPPAEHFGQTLDVYGNTAIVGAHDYEQKKVYAYIFSRETNGAWTQQQKLDLPEEQPFFFPAVALRGDTAFIGINEEGTSGKGIVYTFKRNPVTKIWQQHMAITPQDATFFRFGDSIDVFGDTLVVSGFSRGQQDREFSTVYIFKEDSRGQWQQRQKILLQESTSFWNIVKARIDRDLLVASDSGGDGKFHWDAAFIYERNTISGLWQRKKTVRQLPPSNKHPKFGENAISVDRGTVVIGSNNHDDIMTPLSGDAYIYNKSAGRWTIKHKVKGNGAAPEDEFGFSTEIENNIMVVGSNKGVHAFLRGSDGKWRERQKLIANDMQEGDQFGTDIALSWNTLLVRQKTSDGAGSIVVYEKTGTRR